MCEYYKSMQNYCYCALTKNTLFFIKATTCPEPEVVGSGTKSSSGVSPGDSVTYICDEYYRRVEGDMYRVCQTDETWNGTLPTCGMYNVLLSMLSQSSTSRCVVRTFADSVKLYDMYLCIFKLSRLHYIMTGMLCAFPPFYQLVLLLFILLLSIFCLLKW